MNCSSCGREFKQVTIRPHGMPQDTCLSCLMRQTRASPYAAFVEFGTPRKTESRSLKGFFEYRGTFDIEKMSPEFYKAIFGKTPLVKNVEEADRYGLTKKELKDKWR